MAFTWWFSNLIILSAFISFISTIHLFSWNVLINYNYYKCYLFWGSNCPRFCQWGPSLPTTKLVSVSFWHILIFLWGLPFSKKIVVKNTHIHIKFAILTNLSVQFIGVIYIHNAEQPSPLSISKMFLSPKQSICTHSSLTSLTNLSFTFCLFWLL